MPTRLTSALLPLLFPLLTCAADAPPPDADGFVPLFNGRDLSGWVPVNVAASTFGVKDGMITCTGVPTGVMRTDRMYENFIVELEWRHLVPGGNSGFFVWSDAITSRGVPFTRAVECQVLDGPNGPGNSYTTQGDVFPIHGARMKPDNPGKFAGRAYPTENRSNPSPQWNQYRITCDRGTITLAVNGKVVTSGRDVSPRKGYLCLESEGGKIEFRNLKIKELPADPNLDAKDVARADEGYKSLYTGVDLSGWTEVGGLRPARKAWQPKDWMLRYEAPKAGEDQNWLRTTEKYGGNLEMIADCRMSGPGLVMVSMRGTVIMISVSATDMKKNEPGWRRVHVRTLGDQISYDVDGAEVNKADVAENKASPIGISASGTADFANLYVKKN